MSISEELQSLSPTAIIVLYELDLTPKGGQLHRFHPGVNEKLESVTWQGNVYDPLPISIEGIESSGDGAEARPTVSLSNVQGIAAILLNEVGDILGSTFTRKRTFARFLDAVNFTAGNADADPNMYLPDDVYVVERKSLEDQRVVQFELASALDLENRVLPARQIIKNVCPWQYRSSDCSYVGGPVAKVDDTPTAVAQEDVCGKRLSSCKLRFGANNELPFGGFPASNLIATV